jgi:hypothetical protein
MLLKGLIVITEGCVRSHKGWNFIPFSKIKPQVSLAFTLLEKRFIRTPRGQYWCRLITVANTNYGWLTSRYQ